MEEERKTALKPGEFSREYSYEGMKGIIRNNLENVARAFVTTGFYLRLIEERELYRQDGYHTLEEFAREEYGMGPTWVSRCIRVNERFSEDGYSPKIAEQYRGYNKSQLTEMLPMSEEKLQEVRPDMTVREIRDLKQEREEEKEFLEEQLSGQMSIGDFPDIIPDAAAVSSVETVKTVFPAEDILPEVASEESDMNNAPALCSTGKSKSGFCGAAAYCMKPVMCCADCEEDCNIRCGWLSESVAVATSQNPDLGEEEQNAANMQQEEKQCCEDAAEPEDIYTPQYFLEEQRKILDEYLSVDGLPEKMMQRQKTSVEALSVMAANSQAVDEPESQIKEQPELPLLKNNDQRAAFIDAYENWPLWIETKETGEKYYRYQMTDGNAMVVKVHYARMFDYKMSYDTPWENRYHEGWGREEYYLLKPDKFFYDCKVNRSALIEYLKEVQKK